MKLLVVVVMETQEHREQQDLVVPKEQRDLVDLQEMQDLRELMVPVVLQEIQEIKVLKDFLDLPVPLVAVEVVEAVELRIFLEHLALERKEVMGNMVNQDNQQNLVDLLVDMV